MFHGMLILYLKCYFASVRRRRPSSSSSVRPSVPSVRRRRQPANPRPHANVRTTHQNRGPTASGRSNSESTRIMLQISWVKIEKGIRKVCFTTQALLLQNFSLNVDINFLDSIVTHNYTYNFRRNDNK